MEKIGYALLLIAAACGLAVVLVGMVKAYPVGLIGLTAILGVGFLFAKVVRDRIGNKDDDHYSKTVNE
jgi:hypothetical protein